MKQEPSNITGKEMKMQQSSYDRKKSADERRARLFEQLERANNASDGYFGYYGNVHDDDDADCYCE